MPLTVSISVAGHIDISSVVINSISDVPVYLNVFEMFKHLDELIKWCLGGNFNHSLHNRNIPGTFESDSLD